MTAPVIHRVTALDLRYEPRAWPFAAAARAPRSWRISPSCSARSRRSGTAASCSARDPVFADGRLSASYFEADFASFLAWRDWGFADRGVFNGFGMGALRCADGAFVLGEMAQHTSNAGRIYFPSGHARPQRYQRRHGRHRRQCRARGRGRDRTDAVRLSRRSGLGLRGVGGDDRDGQAVAGRLFRREPARQDRGQSRPAVRSPNSLPSIWCANRADLTADMPRFVTAFIEQQFAQAE